MEQRANFESALSAGSPRFHGLLRRLGDLVNHSEVQASPDVLAEEYDQVVGMVAKFESLIAVAQGRMNVYQLGESERVCEFLASGDGSSLIDEIGRRADEVAYMRQCLSDTSRADYLRHDRKTVVLLRDACIRYQAYILDAMNYHYKLRGE